MRKITLVGICMVLLIGIAIAANTIGNILLNEADKEKIYNLHGNCEISEFYWDTEIEAWAFDFYCDETGYRFTDYLSGDIDATESELEALADKRVALWEQEELKKLESKPSTPSNKQGRDYVYG